MKQFPEALDFSCFFRYDSNKKFTSKEGAIMKPTGRAALSEDAVEAVSHRKSSRDGNHKPSGNYESAKGM